MKQSNTNLQCYTMGYSDLPCSVFLYFLKKEKIDTLVDVRTTPYSSYQPNYNKKEFKHFLESNDIEYLHYGDRLGGYYTEPAFLFEDGSVNYDNVRKRPVFQKGIDDLIDLLKQPRSVCLMCAEKKPQQCHRFILISRELQEREIQVIHIVPCIELIPNQKLEEELLNEMFDPAQRNLFNEPKQDLEDLYLKLGRTGAYRAESTQDSNLSNKKSEIIESSKSGLNSKKDRSVSSDKKTISRETRRGEKDITDDIQDRLF